MRRFALAVPLALAIGAACGAFAPAVLAPSTPSQSRSAIAAALPKPIPQPITRTGPGAQVAWILTVDPTQQRWLTGVDPSGALVASIDVTKLGTQGIARSADGATLVLFTEDRIDVFSAANGTRTATYRANGPHVIASAASPDGRWLALLVPGPGLQLLDLSTGRSETLAIGRDPNAQGMSSITVGLIWGMVTFAADSAHVYTLTDWGRPLRVTAFELAKDGWTTTGQAIDGVGTRFPSCAGPAMAAKVVQGGRTLAAFCHVDGAVWLLDLATLTTGAVLRATQKNPFWLSPIFTPDGQLLYLHQWPAFGDEMQVVDLAGRRVLGPVTTPTKVGDRGPFAWLAPIAYAGGTASTQPISPDGMKLYSALGDGIAVLRVPDLAPVARLASGIAIDEVWVSGDGRTVFAIAGQRLVIAADDGSGVKAVDIGKPYPSFIASERG